MTEIYLRDDRYAQGSAPKLSKENIENILREVNSKPPLDIFPVSRGFIVKFESDEDVNYLMDDKIFQKLRHKYDLSADLSKDTRFYREVLITDVPLTIYEENKWDICDELEYHNNITILYITPFRSHRSGKYFIKIILDTRSSKENIINKGILYLFNARLKAINSCPPPPERSTFPTSQSPPNDINNAWAQGSRQEHTSTSTSQGPSNSIRNAWTEGSRQEHTSTSTSSEPQNEQATTEPNPLKINETFNLKAFDIISSRLSDGLENPDTYIFYFNEMLKHNGYPEVNIPRDILIKKPSIPISQPPASNNDLPSQQPNSIHSTPASAVTPNPSDSSQRPISQKSIPTPAVTPTPSLPIHTPSTPAVTPSPSLPIHIPSPEPQIATLANLATKTLNRLNMPQSLVKDLMKVTGKTYLMHPLNIFSHTSQPNANSPSKMHDSLIPHLIIKSPLSTTSPAIVNPSNSLYEAFPSLTSPILITSTPSQNLINSSIISPIELIRRLFNVTASYNSEKQSHITPKMPKRHTLPSKLSRKNVNTSYKLRTQRRLNHNV